MRKTVLITGATRGIGKSTAIEFAKKDYNVVINYLTSDNLAQELKEYLENTYQIEVLTIKADVSNEEEVIKMITTILDRFSTIDVLVNNAGIAIDSILEDKSVDNFKKILDTNLIGTFLTCKYVSCYMLENQYGKIINVSSTNGIDTYYPYSMDYDASKAGVIALTHNFASLLAPNINVNCVAPGWVMTDMNQELDEEQIKDECDKILLNRFAEPSEIAKVIYFLSTEDAKYINNSVIRVDGGLK